MEDEKHFLTRAWHTYWLWPQADTWETCLTHNSERPNSEGQHTAVVSKAELPRSSWVISDKLHNLSELSS